MFILFYIPFLNHAFIYHIDTVIRRSKINHNLQFTGIKIINY